MKQLSWFLCDQTLTFSSDVSTCKWFLVFLTKGRIGGGPATLAMTFLVTVLFAHRVAKIKLSYWLGVVTLSSPEKKWEVTRTFASGQNLAVEMILVNPSFS